MAQEWMVPAMDLKIATAYLGTIKLIKPAHDVIAAKNILGLMIVLGIARSKQIMNEKDLFYDGHAGN